MSEDEDSEKEKDSGRRVQGSATKKDKTPALLSTTKASSNIRDDVLVVSQEKLKPSESRSATRVKKTIISSSTTPSTPSTATSGRAAE